jgi:hypothetical protein
VFSSQSAFLRAPLSGLFRIEKQRSLHSFGQREEDSRVLEMIVKIAYSRMNSVFPDCAEDLCGEGGRGECEAFWRRGELGG